MRLLIGLDVGWSESKRSCGLAVRGLPRDFRCPNNRLRELGEIRVGNFFHSELVPFLHELLSLATSSGGGVLVIDAPIGPAGPPRVARYVDGACSSAGFYKRAQSYPVTQDTGRRLTDAGYALLQGANWTPWLGGRLPEGATITVAETNPTTALALALPQQEPSALPSRKRPLRDADGRLYRAKSDWYWKLGGGQQTADALGVPAVAAEADHERVAAIFCLALAAGLAGESADGVGAVALGNAEGIYVIRDHLDTSWRDDIERVGVCGGTASFAAGRTSAIKATTVDEIDLSPPESGETNNADEVPRDDELTLTFTDTGGATLKANPWLASVSSFPAILNVVGHPELALSIAPFAPPQHNHQYTLNPKVPEVLAMLGHAGLVPSKERLVSFRVRVSGRVT